MVRRFQIEDIHTQDGSGVVFRALDTETHLPVAVRRFFPFGANGGGLSDDEQEDYQFAVNRLADIRHPAMRSIISGGCDPVDGMPFITTEWVEGTPLQMFIEQGPTAPAEASHLLTQALEVCEQISQVLDEEAVWVETDARTIIVGAADSGRGITFWISPLKWLCKDEGPRGFDCLVDLTEEMMGWRGRMILDQDGEGLGGWLNWLRDAPAETTLLQVREKLAAVARATPTAPVRLPLHPPARAAAATRKMGKSRIPFLVGGILSLAALAFGGWGLIHWNNSRLNTIADSTTMELPDKAPSPREQAQSPAQSSVTEVAVNLPPAADESRPPASEKAPEKAAVPTRKADPAKVVTVASQKVEIAGNNRIYRIEDSGLLLGQLNKVVRLEGTLEGVKVSGRGKGKTVYLLLVAGKGGKGVHGGIEFAKARGDLAESAIAGLKGKKLRIEGTVRGDGSGAARFPVVMIDKRSAIQEIP